MSIKPHIKAQRYVEKPSELPSIEAGDTGKVLTVSNGGSPVWAEAAGGEEFTVVHEEKWFTLTAAGSQSTKQTINLTSYLTDYDLVMVNLRSVTNFTDVIPLYYITSNNIINAYVHSLGSHSGHSYAMYVDILLKKK